MKKNIKAVCNKCGREVELTDNGTREGIVWIGVEPCACYYEQGKLDGYFSSDIWKKSRGGNAL